MCSARLVLQAASIRFDFTPRLMAYPLHDFMGLRSDTETKQTRVSFRQQSRAWQRKEQCHGLTLPPDYRDEYAYAAVRYTKGRPVRVTMLAIENTAL